MKVGIGYSNDANAYLSGKRVAEKAVQSQGIRKADLVLAFCRGGVDHAGFYQGVRSEVGTDTPIIGGSAVGVITNDELSYEGFPAAVAVIESDTMKCRVASVKDLEKGEETAGICLADALPVTKAGRLLLMFYDSVKVPPSDGRPPLLNASAPLLKGLEKQYHGAIPIIGAGLVGDYDFNPTEQFCGDAVATQNAVGALLDGDFTPYFSITHGCTPLDGISHEITAMEGAVIYELDHRPSVRVIDEIYGGTGWRAQQPVKLITIGINHGERFSGPDESAYVNRLIMGVLPGDEGILLFEPDLENGTRIQFMLRDTDEMMRSAEYSANALFKQIAQDRKKAVFGLYIDCAGRTADYSNSPSEEASVIQKIFNSHAVPLLGFYSGVEIAPLLGKNRGLDWTGVLLVFAEDQ